MTVTSMGLIPVPAHEPEQARLEPPDLAARGLLEVFDAWSGSARKGLIEVGQQSERGFPRFVFAFRDVSGEVQRQGFHHGEADHEVPELLVCYRSVSDCYGAYRLWAGLQS